VGFWVLAALEMFGNSLLMETLGMLAAHATPASIVNAKDFVILFIINYLNNNHAIIFIK